MLTLLIIRHRALEARCGVSNAPWPALEWWIVLFIGTHPPITRTILHDLALCRAQVLELIFWHRLGTPIFQILVPTWPHFAPQLGPKIAPRSVQEPSKIHPNLHLIFDPFFDWFLIGVWSIFDPKIDKKSIKNQSTNHPNNTTTKNWKTKVFYCFSFFGCRVVGMICWLIFDDFCLILGWKIH